MDDSVETIVKMYRSGLSIAEISRKTGISREKTRRMLHAQNVGMRHQRIVYHSPRIELDEDVALLLGLHVGDGWLSDKWGIACETKDKSMFHQVTELVRSVLGVEPIKTSECTIGRTVMIRSGQPQALAFFQSYGLPQGRKAGLIRAPKRILESNNDAILKAFLRGLFSTDGCFSFQVDRGPRVEIQVKSRDLRDDFVDLAGRLGFSFRFYTYLPPSAREREARTRLLYKLHILHGRNQ